MTEPPPGPRTVGRRLRWWPALLIIIAAAVAIVVFRSQDTPFQRQNLQTLVTVLIAGALLFLWWVLGSGARWPARLTVAALVFGLLALGASLFRIRGVSGDLLPILELRWTRPAAPAPTSPNLATPAPSPSPAAGASADFPQFLGPSRTANLPEVVLDPDWTARPPQELWRQSLGAAWSGFAVTGDRALTQEQRGEHEAVTCYHLPTGTLLWIHEDLARYATTLGGEGPRCTPTIVGSRVFTLGATGLLNCLDLASGERLWTRDLVAEAGAKVPEWGFAGSPLPLDGLIVVSAGGRDGRSLVAYEGETGRLVWSAGNAPASYSSPVVVELAGVRQILAFQHRQITGHDATTGAVLWTHPWGTGQPQVAVPVKVGPQRVLFSSGYGVGTELFEIQAAAEGPLTVSRVWQSRRMKAKFANLVIRDGFLYGLDDGMLACLDLTDGSQRWKEGRYGHGQGLLLGEHYLLMAESGELVLLHPTPDAPNERHRFRVFRAKTWNPIALAGDRLLVRNDREAACLRLALRPGQPTLSPGTGRARHPGG